ncbi:MAG TPA: hypothetical protein VG269_25610 [Tepidisphaeraceae bacterium]|nr:hypothetical protein [Tepidisphaeraceae bacterium]
MEKAGFGFVVEARLGAGPQRFRNIFMHTFPASRSAEQIWSTHAATPSNVESMPAYQSLRRQGMDTCGLARLSSRTVAVPFVGLTAGCVVISELLRRLHAGPALELAFLSLLSLEDIETVPMEAPIYALGHTPVGPGT